jgi:hypothetical protein
VRWYTQRVDIVLLAKLLKLKGVVALMTIKNKQAMGANCMCLYIGVKVLQLLNSKLVSCLSIIADCNCLVA